MLDLEKINSIRSDKIGFFRFKKLDSDTFLITNDLGEFSYLSMQEFGKFISGKLDSGEKYDELLSKYFIKTENYELECALKYAQKNNYLAYGPVLHIVVVTLRCNHKCQYCHAAVAPMQARDMDMDIETAKKVVDTIFYASSPNITIEFQGGEALLNWDTVKYIIEYAEIKALHLQKALTLAIVTNLTLMDEEKMQYLLDHGVQISTSLDGDEEVHNYNRQYTSGNSFLEVTDWIKKINKEYEKRGIKDIDGKTARVGAVLTVTKKSLPKYREIIDTYLDLGLQGIFIRQLNPYGFAAVDLEKLKYTTEEFKEFYEKSLDYILEINKRGTQFIEMTTSIYLRKIFQENDPNYLDQRSPCGAAIGQIAYNYDGKIYTCDEGRMLGRMGDESFFLANIGEGGENTYNAIIDNETTRIVVQASTLDGLPGYNESVYKPYIGVCPINSYKTSGNLIPTYALDQRRIIDYAMLDYIFSKLKNEEDKKILEGWSGINNE